MQNNGYIQNCTEELSAQSLNTVFFTHTNINGQYLNPLQPCGVLA